MVNSIAQLLVATVQKKMATSNKNAQLLNEESVKKIKIQKTAPIFYALAFSVQLISLQWYRGQSAIVWTSSSSKFAHFAGALIGDDECVLINLIGDVKEPDRLAFFHRGHHDVINNNQVDFA